MTKVYLIRHAEAEGNLYRRAQGQYNSRLTELGHKQLEALAARFENIELDAVYASDLKRTMLTAGAIACGKGLEVIADPRLREVKLGEWENMPWGEIERRDPEQFVNFNNRFDKWFVGGCEPFEVHTPRISSTIESLAALHDGQTIAVVCHAAILRSFLCSVYGLSASEISQIKHCDNTAVSLIIFENGVVTPVFINDASHLTKEITHFDRTASLMSGLKKSLYFVTADLEKDADVYMNFRRDAWITAHGSEIGFSEKLLQAAKLHAKVHPEAVAWAMSGDTRAGVIELDTQRGVKDNKGHISFYYMSPPFRGKFVSIQLLGYAVAVYRALGREKLTLFVAETNTHAIGYYEHFGFVKTGESTGPAGKLFTMEKDITV